MIQINWVWLLIPVAGVILMLWILSRFQFLLLRSKGFRKLGDLTASVMHRDEKTGSRAVPDHVVELIRQGRRGEAIKAMRELSGREGGDGEATVKTWTSEDGTVHVESQTVTYETDQIPEDVRDAIRAGDMKKAMQKLRGAAQPPAKRPANTPAPPRPRRKRIARDNVIPSKEEINDPTPKPFPLDD